MKEEITWFHEKRLTLWFKFDRRYIFISQITWTKYDEYLFSRYWTILFVFLHWVCMAVWLWLLRNYSNPTSTSSNSSSLKPEKKISHLIQVLILSYVYLFDFLNMEEGSSRIRMVLYYTILLIGKYTRGNE